MCQQRHTDRQWGFVGELYQTSVEAPCPLPSSVLWTSDRTDVLTGKGWRDPPRQCWRCWGCGGWGGSALRTNSEPSMAPWKALCDGPLPRCQDVRTGHEGPISIQQDCIEVPPGARHCTQPGERLAGRDRRQDGGVRAVVSRAPGIELHQLRSGDVCTHCPRTSNRSPDSRELGTLRVTEE